MTPSDFSSTKASAEVSGLTELFRYPVPYCGIDVEADMTAQHFYVVHVVITARLQEVRQFTTPSALV